MPAQRRQMQRRGKPRRRRRRKRVRTEEILIMLILGVLVLGGLFTIWDLVTSGGKTAKVMETFRSIDILEGMDLGPHTTLVVLDAGHGGRDQGTSAGDILEKDINLAVVKKLERELEEEGMKVLLTRSDDTKIGLEERAKIANRNQADLFISIHCNYCEDDTGVKGIECYYQESSTEGKELADNIVENLEDSEEIVNRGTRTADFRVLMKTEMPAALVEIGFLSNRAEREKLLEEEYQELLAERLAKGILQTMPPVQE